MKVVHQITGEGFDAEQKAAEVPPRETAGE
jgi:hypothetical protein